MVEVRALVFRIRRAIGRSQDTLESQGAAKRLADELENYLRGRSADDVAILLSALEDWVEVAEQLPADQARTVAIDLMAKLDIVQTPRLMS